MWWNLAQCILKLKQTVRSWSWISWLVALHWWVDCEQGLPVRSHVAFAHTTSTDSVCIVVLPVNLKLFYAVQLWLNLWHCDYCQMTVTITTSNWFHSSKLTPYVLCCQRIWNSSVQLNCDFVKLTVTEWVFYDNLLRNEVQYRIHSTWKNTCPRNRPHILDLTFEPAVSLKIPRLSKL